jgi:hypothetical protein
MLFVMTTMLVPMIGAITPMDANMMKSFVMIIMHVQKIAAVPQLDVNSIL